MNGIKHILAPVIIVMLLICPAYAMTVQEAKDVVLANDPKAVDVKEYWMYQSSETDGMWVVYATGMDKSTWTYEGGAWFVTPEQAVSLGHTRTLDNWEFFSGAPQPAVPDADSRDRSDGNLFPASYVSQGPELMTGRSDRLNAWRLDPASRLPQRIDTGKLVAVHSEFGQLQGMANVHDYDYAFLAIDGNALLQIAATPIEEAVVREFPDGSKLLDQLSAQGYALTGFLYRAAAPGSVKNLNDLPNAAGTIAVNLEKDGQPWHTYFYYAPRKALNYIDGADWGSENELWIATFDGKASDRLDIGLETVETVIQ